MSTSTGKSGLAEMLRSCEERLAATGRLLGVERASRLDQIDALEQDPAFWRDPERAVSLRKERVALAPFAKLWEEWRQMQRQHQALSELVAEPELGEDPSLRDDVNRLSQAIAELAAQASGESSLPGVRERTVDVREPSQTFLIVCEGAKTEPNYFQSFRLPSAAVRIVGTGANTEGLVDEAIRLREQEGEERDQYWCVFDRDSFPAQHFNGAIQRAQAHGFRVAYSNECFEIWYLLHYDYHDAAMPDRYMGRS